LVDDPAGDLRRARVRFLAAKAEWEIALADAYDSELTAREMEDATGISFGAVHRQARRHSLERKKQRGLPGSS